METEFDPDALLADLSGIEISHMEDSIAIASMAPRDALAFVTVDQIVAGHNLRKGDHTLMSRKSTKEVIVPLNPEFVELQRATRDKMRDKRRKQIERARKKRAAIDKERESRPINPVRLGAAWAIVETVVKPISKITLPTYNRFARVLGDTDIHDCVQNVAVKLAEHIARHEIDLTELAEAAIWLHSAPQPYEAADGPDGARMLLGSIFTIAHRTIVDTYRSKCSTIFVIDAVTGETVRKDVTMESFELLDTMARNVGRDVDTMIANSKARQKPKYESKPPTGELSRLFTKVCIDSWITGRDLDWCADLMLSDEHTRTDGSFKWTENARLIFDGFDIPVGDMSDGLLAGYAKRAVRLAFKELPGLVMQVRSLANNPRFLWEVMHNELMIDVMGQSQADLFKIIMLDEKPDALKGVLDMLERDLDDITDHVQWKRRENIVLVPSLDDHIAAQNRGLRVFLEGQEEGEAPTLVYHGPDDSEFKKILRNEPSQYACEHGRRVHIVGVTKKPRKSARVWHGDFCPLPKDASGACDPVFQADKNQDILKPYIEVS